MPSKSRLTKKLKELLIKLTTQYFYYSIVSVKAGISHDSFLRYRKDSKSFAYDITCARQLYLANTLDAANKTGIKDWRYHSHKLAISDPEHFSEKRKVELSTDEGINIIIEKADRKEKK